MSNTHKKRIVTYTHDSGRMGYKPDYSEIEKVEEDDFKEVTEFVEVNNQNPEVVYITHTKVTPDPPSLEREMVPLYRENGIKQIDNMIQALLLVKEQWYLMNRDEERRSVK